MNIVFLSNYFNHHQKPLADALNERCSFYFISTEKITQERRALGWGYNQEPEYVIRYDAEPERAEQLITNADAVIAGSAPEALLRRSIRKGKLVFRYSERPLKNGLEPLKYVPRLLRWHWRNPCGKRIYLLCASGFAASDYARFGLFRNKAYRWGYFPETKAYKDLSKLMKEKKGNSILWAGRFLDWKHPDDAITAAVRLKDLGYNFSLRLIGNGPMEGALRERIKREGLEKCVELLGPMPPEQVRAHMEETEIFLFTSDRHEGWGAVVNEAMNSGCCVVASEAAGSVPYLIEQEQNGLTYCFEDEDGLYNQLRRILDTEGLSARLGAKAYETVADCWNGETAAERLIVLAHKILAGEKYPDLYSQGPCSKETTR